MRAPASPAPRASEPAGSACAATGDVPANGMKEFAVDGINVLIANTGDGFVAYPGAVSARGDAAGAGRPGWIVLTCLEHLWQFDLQTGAPMGDAQVGLTGYRLKEEAGDLYVELKG